MTDIIKNKNASESAASFPDLEYLFRKYGFDDFKWIDPKKIVVSQWVRFKCMYGCPRYGSVARCPPNVPSVEECRQFLSEYKTAVIFHFEKRFDRPEDRKPWAKELNQRLLDLERDIFILGYYKTFLLFMDRCRICDECASPRESCRYPQFSRPTPEGLAIDVFSTVRQLGFPIQTLSEFGQSMNRYAFLFIE